METTEENKNNVRIYPIYKMLSWDLLFYYPIIFLFLTQVKKISAADVLLGESLYPIFKFMLLISTSAFIRKVGKRKSLIIANLINALSILSYIIAQNFTYVVIGQFLSAIAFNIKGIAETNVLYDALPKGRKRGSLFSKIDGKGTSWYYYIDAIFSIASGFLYVINAYIPLILCFIACIISTIISFKFQETKDITKNTITMKKYIEDIRQSFRYVFQSDRLKYLIIFGAILSGIMGMLTSLRSATLKQIGFPEQYFGIVFGILGIISGISSKNQHRFHNRFHNKTLAVLALPTTISSILIGLIVLGNFSYAVTISIILLLFLVQYINKGPFFILIRRYLNNFTTSSLREKISSFYNSTESISRAIIGLLASFLLRFTTASNTMFIIGCISTIIIVLLLDKMRNRVGLQPEEYSEKEIQFTEVK